MLGELTVDDFTPLVGKTFAIEVGDAVIDAILTSAAPCGKPMPGATRQPFSLKFLLGQHQLQQRMYDVRHEKLALSNLFLVPVSPGPDGNCMEAVFS